MFDVLMVSSAFFEVAVFSHDSYLKVQKRKGGKGEKAGRGLEYSLT